MSGSLAGEPYSSSPSPTSIHSGTFHALPTPSKDSGTWEQPSHMLDHPPRHQQSPEPWPRLYLEEPQSHISVHQRPGTACTWRKRNLSYRPRLHQLEEEGHPEAETPPIPTGEKGMGRWYCKNTFKNIKSKIAPPKTSGSTSSRPEYLSADKAEKNTLKIIL